MFGTAPDMWGCHDSSLSWIPETTRGCQVKQLQKQATIRNVEGFISWEVKWIPVVSYQKMERIVLAVGKSLFRPHHLFAGWWFQTFFLVGGFKHSLFSIIYEHYMGIIIPTDSYFSEGLKPPTSHHLFGVSCCMGCHVSLLDTHGWQVTGERFVELGFINKSWGAREVDPTLVVKSSEWLKNNLMNPMIICPR